MSDNILANSRLASYLVDASINVSYLKAPLNTVNDVAAQTKITLVLITLLITGRGRFRSAGDCCEILSFLIIVDDMQLN